MKNITLKIDDETYRNARIRAASQGTSVSALVREFLVRECAPGGDLDNAHQRITDTLSEIYAEADARAARRSEPLAAPTRDEIYAERLR
jgi:plasmid stability protein